MTSIRLQPAQTGPGDSPFSPPRSTWDPSSAYSTTGGTLGFLTFAENSYFNAGTKLIVQAFNAATMTATGTILYSGFGTTAGNGDSAWADGNGGYFDNSYFHTFANIGVNLTAGTSYVAYLVDSAGTDTFNGSTTYGYT